jgi:hypothetical protein
MQLRIAYLCSAIGWGGEMNQLKNLPFIELKKHKNHYDFIRAWKLFRLLKLTEFSI